MNRPDIEHLHQHGPLYVRDLCSYALALEARVAELEAGLKPFANSYALKLFIGWSTYIDCADDVRRARALLTNTEKTDD